MMLGEEYFQKVQSKKSDNKYFMKNMILSAFVSIIYLSSGRVINTTKI